MQPEKIVSHIKTVPVARMVELFQSWIDAYPEDCEMFAPMAPAFSESEELQQYRTRASAAMGRHMGRALIRQLGQILMDESFDAPPFDSEEVAG